MQKITLSLVLYTLLFSGVVFSEEKANDPQNKSVYLKEKPADQPNIPKIEYPELPTDVPEVKELIDLANLVIDQYNNGKLQESLNLIQERFKSRVDEKSINDRIAANTHSVKIQIDALYRNIPPDDRLDFGGISILDVRERNQPQGGKCILPVAVITFKDGKVRSVSSNLFCGPDDFLANLVLKHEKPMLRIFSYEKGKETPFVQWDENGKPKVEKKMQYFEDYRQMPLIISGEVEPSQVPAVPAKK